MALVGKNNIFVWENVSHPSSPLKVCHGGDTPMAHQSCIKWSIKWSNTDPNSVSIIIVKDTLDLGPTGMKASQESMYKVLQGFKAL